MRPARCFLKMQLSNSRAEIFNEGCNGLSTLGTKVFMLVEFDDKTFLGVTV